LPLFQTGLKEPAGQPEPRPLTARVIDSPNKQIKRDFVKVRNHNTFAAEALWF
jgi:hypothetical protein